MHVKVSDLTPGVLDGYALHAFKVGACGALAIALHEEMGWPIYAVTDAHNVEDGVAGGGSALHWVVKRPDGLFIDVDGAHTRDALVAEYDGEADEGGCAIGKSTRADCWEWYGEAQGEPIPVAFAKSFVDAVVANASSSSLSKSTPKPR